MLLHGHHSFLGLSFHGGVDLLPIPRPHQVSEGRDVFQNLHRQNTPIAVGPRHQFLTEHEGQAKGQLQAEAFGLFGGKHIHDATQGTLRVAGVKGRKNQMTGFRSAQG